MRRIGTAILAAALVAASATAKPSTEAALRAHIATLASDAFEGRAPGTEGEAKTIAWISDNWAKAGLKPGAADGGWLQPVPLVRRGPVSADVAFTARGEKLRFADEEILLIGKEAHYVRDRLPVIFAGYGVGADGRVAANVAGKAVFILADRVDFLPDTMQSVRARREALVAAGAEAVIIIGGEQGEYAFLRRLLLARPLTLVSREVRAPLEGVVGAQFAVALVTKAGGDWDRLRKAANASDFAGLPLGIEARFDVKTDVHAFDSHNVIGKISGRKPGSGAVLFMGHWDHLGLCRPEGDADRICNGAVDNASGIAVLSEVARGLAKSKPDRDIYFLATTAEESGLYGAYAFAENPVVPLGSIVAAFNLDTVAIAPKGAKVTIIGRGTTTLDSQVEAIAKWAGRKIDATTASNAFIRRQDGWALAQKGVPALMVGGAFADLDLTQKFLDSHYHGPADELTDKTELGGAVDDTLLHIALGKYFADTKKYQVPNNTGG